MILKKLLNSTNIVEKIAESADRFIQTKEEKNEFLKELYSLALADKQSARSMFKSDSTVQKIFALSFLSGYICILVYFLYSFSIGGFAGLIDWQIAFLSSIFASLTSKLNTITDFLFGSSTEKKS